MLRARIQYAAISLALVAAGYWTYAVCAVPWIEPPLAERTHTASELQASVRKPNERYQHLLAPYFAADSWEMNDAQVLRNRHFILLLKEYEQLENGRQYRLSPCTLIFHSADDDEPADSNASQGQTVILQAPEGAILEFDRPFDLKHGGLGQLVSGILRGEVLIRSHGALGDQGSLVVRTKHVQLNDERIWTPYEVDVRWGQNVLRGRDMTVRLVTDEQARLQLVRDDVTSRIQSVELVQVDLLRLMMPGEMFREKADGKTAPEPAPQVPVVMQCAGRMLIDMLVRIATLEDQVTVRHDRGNDSPDLLRCDAATLHFARRPHLNRHQGAQDDDTSVMPDFEVVHVTALGNPAHLDLPTWDIEARGRRLEHHVRDRRVLLSDAQEAYARYGTHVIRSPRIDCQFSDSDSLTVDAEGPGRYDYQPPAGKGQPVQARWQGSLRVQPDEDRHMLSLVGGARIEALQWGYLSADQLDFWAWRTAPRHPVAPAEPGTGATLQWTPDRMRAEGNVAFDSPRLGGRTQLLQVWLSQQDAPKHDQLVLNQPEQSSIDLDRAGGGGHHFMLEGEQVNAQLVAEGDALSVEKATVRGRVRLAETPRAGHQQDSFVMTGQTLQLEDASLDSGMMAIYGAPAGIRARGVEVSATEIHVDRTKSHIWINVPGSIAIPLPARIAAEFARPRPTAQISWQGRMDFDGQTVRCFRNIEIRSPAQLIQAQSLQAALTAPLDLSRTRLNTDQLEIGQVQVAGNVWMENHSFDDQGLASIDRALLRQLTVDQISGDIVGEGPGSVSSVRRGQPETPIQKANHQGMTYLQVDFREGIDGNIKARELSFVGNVQAIYGPVDAWNKVLDVSAEIPPGSPNVRMKCETLTITQMAHGQQLEAVPLEFKATGDTLVEGHSFAAKADRISFDQQKDLLVIEGDDRNPAQLWRQTNPGAPRTYLKARKLQYWPHSNRYRGENVTGDLIGLGG